MDPLFDDDDDLLDVPLDPETRAWLEQLSRLTGDSPGRMVASMLHDIRVDDESAHRKLH